MAFVLLVSTKKKTENRSEKVESTKCDILCFNLVSFAKDNKQ